MPQSLTTLEQLADQQDAERHRVLMAQINQAPVRGPEHWPGGVLAKTMPNSLKPYWHD